MAELTSLTLELRPQHHQDIPQWLGRATHAWFLQSVGDIHRSLSSHLHDMDQLKPFTVSNLIGGKRHQGMIRLDPKQTYRLRVTTLHSDLSAILKHGLTSLWWRKGIQLHDQQFHLVNVQTHGDWNVETLYYDLLDNASTQALLKINFGAPATFKQNGQVMPLPIPELVFRSLLTRWESYANVPIEMDVMEYVRHNVTIYSQKTQSQTVRFIHGKRTEYVTGFTGEAVYHLGENPHAIQILNALGEYSLFSGIGMKTTMGLGQSRMVS